MKLGHILDDMVNQLEHIDPETCEEYELEYFGGVNVWMIDTNNDCYGAILEVHTGGVFIDIDTLRNRVTVFDVNNQLEAPFHNPKFNDYIIELYKEYTPCNN